MHPNWSGVAAAVLSVCAFFLCYSRAKKAEPGTRLALTFAAVLTAVPGVSFSIYYAHLFPEKAWYFQFRSLPGTEWLVVFTGIAGGFLASVLPRLLLSLAFLGTVLFSFVPFLKPFIGPISEDAFRDRWDDGVCLQSTPSTCGAASVATILRSLGEIVGEKELAAEAHSYSGGTEAWYLARAVRRRGYNARFEFLSGFDERMEIPTVTGVKLGGIGHFVPVTGREGGRFVIGDPLTGRELLSSEELAERYSFTGFCLVIGRKTRI